MSSARSLKMPARPSANETHRSTNIKMKTAGPKHRVVFVEERNSVHEFEKEVDPARLPFLWQQHWEMFEGKEVIKRRAQKWRQTGMGAFLDNVYHCDNDLSSALCQRQLNTLAQLPDEMNMRGLERYLSKKHDQERTTRKYAIAQQVVARYHTLQAQDHLTAEESERFLAQFSRRLNQDAERLARRMALADEFVIRKGPARSIHNALALLEYLHDVELENIHNKKMRQQQQRKNDRSSPTSSSSQPQPPLLTAARRRIQARQA